VLSNSAAVSLELLFLSTLSFIVVSFM